MDNNAALENIIALAMSWRQTNAPSPMDIPDELIAEVLSFLTVKSIFRLKSLSKSWNTLISNPTFVKMHLKRSARNPHIVPTCEHYYDSSNNIRCYSVVPFSLCRLLENPCTTIAYDPRYQWNEKECRYNVVGFSELLLPRGFGEVPVFVQPVIGVFNDCLCYYHDFKRTNIVIWQMKEFGVQASWTQLFKISYQSLPIVNFKDVEYPVAFLWLPLCLFENGDTLILASREEKAILYSRRDNRVLKTISITNQMQYNRIWWNDAKNYIESLVSVPLFDGSLV